MATLVKHRVSRLALDQEVISMQVLDEQAPLVFLSWLDRTNAQLLRSESNLKCRERRA